MTDVINRGTRLFQKEQEKAGWKELARKSGLFLLFLICAVAVFVFGSNYYSIFPTNNNIYYEGGIAAVFLVASVLLRWQPRFQQYWQIAYAFFVAAAVILTTSLTRFWVDDRLHGMGLIPGSSQWQAIAKVIEAAITIGIVLFLSRLAGMSLGSLYIKRGNLKWGLILGIGVLINFASSSLMFFYDRYSSLEAVGAAALWGLVFSLANGFMEELWLRGQFLRKLEPLLGGGAAIVLTALWWSLFHVGAFYFTPVAILFFLANLVTFGLSFGYAMKKLDSWIAPGLMHAASDLFLFFAKLGST